MKKYPRKRRERDVRRTIMLRRHGGSYFLRTSRRKREEIDSRHERINRKFEKLLDDGVAAYVSKGKRVTLRLPGVMNLSSEYSATMKYIHTIRILSKSGSAYRCYKLGYVDFSGLTSISSSAALLLTAEISRWDDSVRNKLKPNINSWDPDILRRFYDLGFFELFRGSAYVQEKVERQSSLLFVRYIKAHYQSKDYRSLKLQLQNLVGAEIKKWAFLHGGLDEAITNVGHHAYPQDCSIRQVHRNWYLTGAFNSASKELKVVFYDQGIGIPRSLPSSKLWERVLDRLSGLPAVEARKHATLIRAAMNVDRTRTSQSDRGKGLPDMKEFIIHRGGGYLTIMSGFGLYKFSIMSGKRQERSDRLDVPIEGTLIIWKVEL